VECQQCRMKVAIEKNLFWQKTPVHRPLEQELTTELK